jgi:hypothetical protein
MIFVAGCPIAKCKWHSEPLRSLAQAQEARRAHLSDHSHGQLVDHAATFARTIEQYEQVVADGTRGMVRGR